MNNIYFTGKVPDRVFLKVKKFFRYPSLLPPQSLVCDHSPARFNKTVSQA